MFLGAGHDVAGKMAFDELLGMSENAIRGPGVCSGMGTANSMHIVCEALGMALPGSAPVLAELATGCSTTRAPPARRIVADGLGGPEAARHPDAAARFANAARAVLAVVGSINCIKHLQATAIEAGSDLDVYAAVRRLLATHAGAERGAADRRRLDRSVRGGRRRARRDEAARAAADTGALTVTGKTVGENLRDSRSSTPR